MIIFHSFIEIKGIKSMETLDGNVASTPGMGLSPRAMQALGKAAGWGKFISIVGICCIGIYLLISLFALLTSIAMIGQAPQMFFMMLAGIALYVLILICFIKLMQFSFSAAKAVQMHNSMALESAMEKLSSYFTLTGIATIISLALIIIVAIVMVFFGLAFGNSFGRF
ncbi:MAG: hypothetical protein ACI9J3_001219 [Parvicellaceae bacterium]|jgi:hypothetical protein